MDAITEKNLEIVLAELDDDVELHQTQLQDNKRRLNEQITLLKQAIETQKKIILELESERQLLKSALMSIPAGILIADSKTRQVVFTNKYACKFQPARTKHIHAIRSYHPSKAYKNSRLCKHGDWPIMRSLRHNKTIDKEEIKYIDENNYTHHLHVSSSPIHNERGKKIAAIEMHSDISKRKETETRQRESEQMHRNVFESAWHGIVILNPQGQLIECNPAFAQLLGYTRKEMLKLCVKDFVSAEHQEQLIQLRDQLLNDEQVTAEMILIRKDGRCVSIEVGAGATFTYHGQRVLLSFTRDLTEIKKVEQQLRQHQLQLAHAARMNTLGELTAGIAHELNQPLGAIINYTKGCIRRLNNTPPLEPNALITAISEIGNQAERAGEIILRLRRFAKKGELKQTETDPNEVVRESLRFLQPETTSHDITIRKKFARQLPQVLADKIQLEQVIVNVIKNAIDALIECPTEQRRIYVQTSLINEGEIEILIHDFGPGFQPDEVAKIFQPFYTTKNDGLGVGLSISQTIIEAHGGHIKATPLPKEGACFRITLPAMVQQGEKK